MHPHPIHRPRRVILLTLATVAALSVAALAWAPVGQAVEYPYPPYPEETPPTTPSNPYPNPYPSPSPPSTTPSPSPPMTGARSKRVVKVAQNSKLGHKVLTNTRGRTLYSLSAEKNGTFICSDPACLSIC